MDFSKGSIRFNIRRFLLNQRFQFCFRILQRYSVRLLAGFGKVRYGKEPVSADRVDADRPEQEPSP